MARDVRRASANMDESFRDNWHAGVTRLRPGDLRRTNVGAKVGS
ncbi:hypothetical protein BRAS3843_520006 [Bradyrhizobium sp. STM 3843]|nr:hypothetical protein BRAS3843_520006 [Bradyrhizobium sp. STM 3843]